MLQLERLEETIDDFIEVQDENVRNFLIETQVDFAIFNSNIEIDRSLILQHFSNRYSRIDTLQQLMERLSKRYRDIGNLHSIKWTKTKLIRFYEIISVIYSRQERKPLLSSERRHNDNSDNYSEEDSDDDETIHVGRQYLLYPLYVALQHQRDASETSKPSTKSIQIDTSFDMLLPLIVRDCYESILNDRNGERNIYESIYNDNDVVLIDEIEARIQKRLQDPERRRRGISLTSYMKFATRCDSVFCFRYLLQKEIGLLHDEHDETMTESVRNSILSDIVYYAIASENYNIIQFVEDSFLHEMKRNNTITRQMKKEMIKALLVSGNIELLQFIATKYELWSSLSEEYEDYTWMFEKMFTVEPPMLLLYKFNRRRFTEYYERVVKNEDYYYYDEDFFSSAEYRRAVFAV